MKRRKLNEIRKCLRKSADFIKEKEKDTQSQDWWQGTANGLLLAADLLDGKVVGDVLPKFLKEER